MINNPVTNYHSIYLILNLPPVFGELAGCAVAIAALDPDFADWLKDGQMEYPSLQQALGTDRL